MKHNTKLDELTVQSVMGALEHQRKVQALELETATLRRDQARVELEVQQIIKSHVVDIEKTMTLKLWASGKPS